MKGRPHSLLPAILIEKPCKSQTHQNIHMDFNQDIFLILLLRQIDNCTTWDEDRYIDRMLQKYPKARQLKQDVRETYPEQAARHPYFVTDPFPLRVVGSYEAMLEEQSVATSKRKRRYFNFAAGLLVAIATCATLLKIYNKPEPLLSTTGANGVVLQVAKGETIPLGTHTDTIPTRYALLSTNSGMLRFKAGPGSNGLQQNTIVVPATHIYSITLADGTIVHMNAATSLRFPFTFDGHNREVYVEGEAYFSVAADAKHPFIVHTGKGDVTVLGTAFNVNTYGNNFRVSLLSGSVIVKDKKGNKTLLAPCEEAAIDPVSRELFEEEFESDDVLGWMHGFYRFQDQPLAEVCQVAERLYGVRVQFDSERLARLKYSGVINKYNPLTTFLGKLKDNGGIGSYYYDGEGVIHLSWNKNKVDKVPDL